MNKFKNFKCLDDRVLVKRDNTESQTESGLFIPEEARSPSQKGTVIAVGDGRLFDNGTVGSMRVSVGDRVLFNKTGAISISNNEEEYVLMSERTIYAIVGKE